MLVAVETYFLNALKTALPEGTNIVAGPSAGPGTSTAPRVEIVASKLTFPPDKSDEGAVSRARGPAFFTRIHSFAADGAQHDFVLPAEEDGEVAEVQSPPGRLAIRGDDYIVEGRAIRFYMPPACTNAAVIARLRGARARGYMQRLGGQIELSVHLWARDRPVADTLSTTTLSAMLMAAERLGILEDPAPPIPTVSMRLLHATSTLTAITRGFEPKSPKFHTVEIHFMLRGELEQIVILGEPELEGIIREVRQA